jgi:Sigma-70 region 2
MAEELQTPPSTRLGAETGEHDDGLSAFAGVRPRLFGIAYRMLGSASEAEDVVQDVWLRGQSTNRKVVENPPAFLATTTTRLCINLAQSAHTRRETYVGTWLPEPGVPATLGTIDASAQGIDQIMWFLRPSKLAAVSKSGQGSGDSCPPGLSSALNAAPVVIPSSGPASETRS